MRSRFGVLVAMAMVVGVLLSVLLLEGCSDSSSPQTTGTPMTETKPSGSLISTNGVLSLSYDPKMGGGTAYRSLLATFIDSLVGLDPKGNLKPGLAERWEISDDGLTHTFYIRKGVKFHDGSDLTGGDVKFSIERVMQPDATNNVAPIWRAQVMSVELKDAFTVALHLKAPQFELLKGLSDFTGGPAAVLPKKYIEEKGIETWLKTLVGSGPWKVANYVPGASLVLEANENYWDTTQVPKFKDIKIIDVPEEQTKISMLKTGELDIADVSVDSAPSLKAAGLRVLTHSTGTAYGMVLFYDMDNPKDYAFGDVRVRKALSLAVNRKEMADKLLSGYGEPAALSWVRPGADFYDANVLKPDPYDPEGAKKLLAEAGYPNGFSTRLVLIPSGIAQLIVEATGAYWGNIGVKAEIAGMTNYVPLFMPKQVPQVWNSALAMPGQGPLQFDKMVTGYHSTKSSLKNTRNPRLDYLIDQAPLTRDPVEKKKLELEAAVLAKNEYSVIGTVYVPELWAVSSKVGNWTLIDGIEGLGSAYQTITHPK